MITIDSLQREVRLMRRDYLAAQRERDESMEREKALRARVAALEAALLQVNAVFGWIEGDAVAYCPDEYREFKRLRDAALAGREVSDD